MLVIWTNLKYGTLGGEAQQAVSNINLSYDQTYIKNMPYGGRFQRYDERKRALLLKFSRMRWALPLYESMGKRLNGT